MPIPDRVALSNFLARPVAKDAINAWLAAEDEERVDRVARAIYDGDFPRSYSLNYIMPKWDRLHDNEQKGYLTNARAVLKALSE